MAILVCPICGKEFVTSLAKINAGKKYCSVKCKNESARVNLTPKRVKTACLQCGVEYIVPEAWLREGRRKFCSRKCRNAYMRQQTGPKAARYGKAQTSETRDKISQTRIAKGITAMGEDHPAWKGGRAYSHGGYMDVLIRTLPEDQQAMAHQMTDAAYIKEHRLVAAMMVGRPLTKHEVVHHINGKKSDNRPENLMIQEWGKHSHEHHQLLSKIGELEAEIVRLKSLLATYQTNG